MHPSRARDLLRPHTPAATCPALATRPATSSSTFPERSTTWRASPRRLRSDMVHETSRFSAMAVRDVPPSASPATCSRRLRPARRTPWLLYRPTTQEGSCCLPPSTQSSARFASPPPTSHHGTPSPGLAHLLHAAGHPSWQGDRLEDARRLRRLWRRRVCKGDGAARQLAGCTAHAHAHRPPQVSPQKLCPVALTAGGSRGDSRAGTAAATIFSHRRALRAGCACSSRTSSCRTSPTSTLRCSRTTAAARRSRLAR